MRSKPVRMQRVFDDPDAVLDLVSARSPYRSMLAYYNQGADDSELDTPWFIDIPRADILVQNPHWIAAAKEAFSAEIVQPLHCTINLNGPAGDGSPHMDLPVFRGLSVPDVPVWLLMAMSYSGLFFQWLVPVASGLAWFYRGEGGDFEYWPDGPTKPSIRERAPLWNVGVMSDNEVMWHRVMALGDPDVAIKLAGKLKTSAVMQRVGERWEINDHGEQLCVIEPEALRISLLWKAYVFSDADHLASFKNNAYDLDLGEVVEIFLADLARRGVEVQPPGDPRHDPDWQAVLNATYKSPFE